MKKELGCLCVLLLLGADGRAQQQSVDQKQQSKQTQRLYQARVDRQDEETVLDDPAVASELTQEQTLPDSNELNVDSRVLTIDDLQQPRIVHAPAPDDMQFVPGRGYVAGTDEEATEPGLSAVAQTLGSQSPTQTLGPQSPASQVSQQGQGATETEPDASLNTPFMPLDHLGSEIGENSDPLQKQVSAAGLNSPLSRPPAIVFRPQETRIFRPLDQVPEGRDNPFANPFANPFGVSGRNGNSSRCDSDLDLSKIHDPALLQRLERMGCKKNSATDRDATASRGAK